MYFFLKNLSYLGGPGQTQAILKRKLNGLSLGLVHENICILEVKVWFEPTQLDPGTPLVTIMGKVFNHL